MPPPALSRSALVAGLRALGVREGSVLMVHARMSALGWVVGGSGTVVSALLEALGPEGTLVAYGAGSPFARIVTAGGDVLLLGAPLETLTLLHHAEANVGTRGAVGAATCHRFPAAELTRFGTDWIDRHFI